jgi:hypothetical protein
MAEGVFEQLMQAAIRKHRRCERECIWCVLHDVVTHGRERRRIEVENAPRARPASDRAPVVHFAGIHADEGSRTCLDLPSPAP